MWENLQYFLERIMPVAEEQGVLLAMHPVRAQVCAREGWQDDPPLAELRGIQRIMNSVDDFKRLLRTHPSAHNGICLDVSLFGLMRRPDEPRVPELIRLFDQRIHFVHFRDVVGDKTNHTEVFHDQQGLSDHVAVFQALKRIQFRGVIRPDHVPLLAGEAGHATGDKAQGYFSGKASGYTMQGRLFAVGYLRGLMQAVWHQPAKL
eukprot:TRINITY_DN1864_c0_g1_i2.p1 TRINITY_DN1864_c0_g1~~TRINITY_DN1864_c0_g1_i2.p1  ORF type:complete len:205 (+),score=53.07 TRINITY_DN1864_c0_g1_i2:458-1072(+)